jgi:serine/threonine protein kinase
MNTEEENVYGSVWTGPVGDDRRYRVDLTANGLEKFGEGGEGLVYRAVRSRDSDDVALKMLTSVPLSDYERVRQRCNAISQVQHPNIMQQLETFVGSGLWTDHEPDNEDFDILYTVARWVPGRALGDAVRATVPDVALRWVCQIGRAIQFLHSFRSRDAPDGIVHRDVKPSNIRIRPDGLAVLIDFGTARPLSDSDLTQGAGTFLWRAPEVLGWPGTPGPASDSWGIGALAYWVLIGEATRLEGADVARERLLHRCNELGVVEPEALSAQIAGLLESHPARRCGNLDEWAESVEAMLDRANTYVAPSKNSSSLISRIDHSTVSGDSRPILSDDSSTNNQPWSRRYGRRTKLGWRRLLVGCAVVASVTAVIVGVATLRPTSPSAIRAVTYVFKPQSLSSGLRVSRVWTLSGSSHDDLTSALTISNTGLLPISQVYDEVIPSQIASTVSKLAFVGAAHEVVQADPVVSYRIEDLAPGGEEHASYSTTLAPSNLEPLKRLNALGVIQDRDEHTYLTMRDGQGPSIAANTIVQVTCRVIGFKVADGNTWWYQIESNPWNNSFWASADAFHNNSAAAGSLDGTPFFDSNVPICGTRRSSNSVISGYIETTGGITHTWVNYFDAGGPVISQLPTQLSISPANPVIEVGDRVTLHASGMLADGSRAPSSSLRGLRWFTSDPKVALVDQGVVNGVKSGVAYIVVIHGPLRFSVKVTIKQRSTAPTNTTTTTVTKANSGSSSTSTTRPKGHPTTTTSQPKGHPTTTTSEPKGHPTTTTTQVTATTTQVTTTTTKVTTTTSTSVTSAPTDVTITFLGGGNISTSWDPPASSNGGSISGYNITNILGSTPCTNSSCPLRATDPGPPVQIGGLTSGKTYTFCVAANDQAGTGPFACSTYTMP